MSTPSSQSPQLNAGSGSTALQGPGGFQAAKYFTFVFFGVSILVVLMFTFFVFAHCFRRIGLRRRVRRENRTTATETPAEPVDIELGRPQREPRVDIPLKEFFGVVVQHPDGTSDVAYSPDHPLPPKPVDPIAEAAARRQRRRAERRSSSSSHRHRSQLPHIVQHPGSRSEAAAIAWAASSRVPPHVADANRRYARHQRRLERLERAEVAALAERAARAERQRRRRERERAELLAPSFPAPQEAAAAGPGAAGSPEGVAGSGGGGGGGGEASGSGSRGEPTWEPLFPDSPSGSRGGGR